MNDCKDCIQIKNLEDKIKALWHEVTESKEQRKEFEKRINELEIHKGETKEKFDRIFSSIEAIEKNIEKIANSLEQLQIKPARTYEKLTYEVIKYVVIAGIAFVMAKFIN
jgi:septal ring factor EnvC (AmiA/AmiB activator)